MKYSCDRYCKIAVGCLSLLLLVSVTTPHHLADSKYRFNRITNAKGYINDTAEGEGVTAITDFKQTTWVDLSDLTGKKSIIIDVGVGKRIDKLFIYFDHYTRPQVADFTVQGEIAGVWQTVDTRNNYQGYSYAKPLEKKYVKSK